MWYYKTPVPNQSLSQALSILTRPTRLSLWQRGLLVLVGEKGNFHTPDYGKAKVLNFAKLYNLINTFGEVGEC